ncbi:ABC transporter ATP-binding protein [Reichenbachiella ulvae]|uniref:ABC transporter ATP-binding protein n=1 Tax=Reichenbachiella ulvae TaxID=2980104 RepID=A0ABT3CPV5_9BACT|nr:ABC transporter ATP-binding protein [Reichenbachiella ulvae]MCV9385766.1 ABC transporter ATP-binding protein [Reichenbachiella ulvae]
MSEEVIDIQNLVKTYPGHTAVDGLNLKIRKGEVFGLLGPNGAGKSTTILMLMGMTDPSEGSLRVCGIDPTRQPVEVKRKVGYLPENVGFYEDRSGLDNLVYLARLNGFNLQEAESKAEEMLEKVGLTEAAHKKVGQYSRGMRQRLGLADTLIKSPEVIILDEPTLGIDPKGVKELLALITRLSKEEGLTVLLSSHHLHQVQQVCDRVGLFVAGKLIAEGDLESLSQQLFAESEQRVEAHVSADNPSKIEQAIQQISALDEVKTVERQEDRLQITCTGHSSPRIAREIAAADLDLINLSQKQLGLDEIYQRYFEGGENE